MNPFLQAILESPDDNTLRLIAADFLEEKGDPLGEFIRVQVTLSQWEDGEHCPICGLHWKWRVGAGHTEWSDCQNNHRWCSQNYRDLAGREKQLLQPHWINWYPVLPTGSAYCTNLLNYHVAHGYNVTFQRGFVSRIELPTTTFLQYTDTLFSTAPIEEVYLSDADSYLYPVYGENHTDRRVYFSRAHLIPAQLFDLLKSEDQLRGSWKRFSNRNLAVTALSHACISLGRQRAGLPIITPRTQEKKTCLTKEQP